ncbi:MAG TPA: disulfide bond formation protein B [Devosia sp.]|uniref:disulfide bond formation protein B n=1 Tax=Devosia sp. TaxID=1871048 RepID=UPI002DDD74CD|nr:disulfide bond formation protein B [Devosia sp.]HEV2514477.1 disulfide bond formation protein B [Devosia sp.]
MTTSLAADRSRLLATISFVLGLATIAGAWGSQLFGGLVPCELCLEQRMPYYWGLPLLALLLILWNRLPRAVWYVGLVLVLLTFVWSTYLAGYHAGVEYGFWPGPTACTGTGVDVSFSDLTNINAARVVPCDKIQFSLFGVTLAGANTLISAAIVAMLGAALLKGRKA